VRKQLADLKKESNVQAGDIEECVKIERDFGAIDLGQPKKEEKFVS
jgi:hypothetical protein